MGTIFKHSHFESNPFLNGGNKRTAQINELLNKATIDFIEANFSPYTPAPGNLLMLIKGLTYNWKNFSPLKNSYAIGRYLKQFETFVKYEKPSFFIWESVSEYNLLLSKVLHDNNIPFISLPHNIESLVEGSRSPFSNLKSPYWFFEELNYLKLSNSVFTISKEEQWLLSVNGISANYLPYHPTEKLKCELLKIRERKKDQEYHVKKINVLLLGTFHNKPTYDGYVELIEQLKNHNNLVINVCGFGSESLKGKFSEHHIKIRGSVSNEELNEIIAISDFGIIHQKPSSGALTRISELLIAGLPLFVNKHAARSSPSNDELYIYDSLSDLLDLISSFEKRIPPVLDRPKEEIIFMNQIAQMTEGISKI